VHVGEEGWIFAFCLAGVTLCTDQEKNLCGFNCLFEEIVMPEFQKSDVLKFIFQEEDFYLRFKLST